MGTRPSAVATLVERTSRYTAIVALPDGIKAEQVTPHLTRSLLGIPPSYDERSSGTGAGRWPSTRPSPPRPGCRSTCASRAARGNGTNENTNRLLRQYLPKGADLRTFSQADLDAIAHELNHRPRKTHGYRTPVEVYAVSSPWFLDDHLGAAYASRWYCRRSASRDCDGLLALVHGPRRRQPGKRAGRTTDQVHQSPSSTRADAAARPAPACQLFRRASDASSRTGLLSDVDRRHEREGHLPTW